MNPRKTIRTYQDLRDELRRLEARDMLERLQVERQQAAIRDHDAYVERLRRVWMVKI